MLVTWLFGHIVASVLGVFCYLAQFFVGIRALATYLEIYHGGAAAKELYSDASLVATLRRAIGVLRR
jgi:hypothetical protein